MNYRVALGTVAIAALLTGVGAAQSVPGGVPGSRSGANSGPSTGSGATSQPPAPPLPNTANRTPSPLTTSTPAPSPSASASPAGKGRRGRGPSDAAPNSTATETPAPPQFSTFDGVWEVQMQPALKHTIYSHLAITQHGDDLSGTWNKDAKTKIPFTGTWDGSRLFKITLKDTAGKELTMSGYEENYGDMVGVLDDGKTRTAFTASHRKKLKFSDQAPSVGVPGLGGGGAH